VRDDRVLEIEHGKPLLFGKDKHKGIRFSKEFEPQIVELSADGKHLGEVHVWDETAHTPAPAMALASMSEDAFPVPIGVFRRRERPTFESGLHSQLAAARAKKQESLKDLLHTGEVWTVG
jgi:2-oxoglutarate ferredoxin oxidoreductase subunit beta